MISNHIPPGHTHIRVYPSNCPTQRHAHRLLMCLYSQSVPTELQSCRSNCSHFLTGFKYHCSQQVSRSEDEQLCKFPRNGVTYIQKCAWSTNNSWTMKLNEITNWHCKNDLQLYSHTMSRACFAVWQVVCIHDGRVSPTAWRSLSDMGVESHSWHQCDTFNNLSSNQESTQQ